MKITSPLYKAAFLGPKGENALEFERLLLEVLHDHIFWRRNFHPSDPRLVEEGEKQTPAYGRMVARLRDELFQILAELKRGAPLYAPRQIGHMVSDPTLPALVGYFAGLLYNQNNVVAEAAPETVRKERAYMAALARMIGYPPMLPERIPGSEREAGTAYSWGHLCSGGTAANLEALWIARNVRFYPLALRLLGASEPAFARLLNLETGTADRTRACLGELATFELFNLPIGEIAELYLRVQAMLREAGREQAEAFDAALPSVRKVGLAAFLQAYNDCFPKDPCRVPVVLISQAAHYGWAKAMDVVGLGVNALTQVPVDYRIRLDVGALAETVRARAEQRQPVLMVISICGTTEEGAVDPLHEIEALRERLQGEGITFWHHTDAAFGGFLASMLPRDETGAVAPFERFRDREGTLLRQDVYEALTALSETDSVTIDPHKFGYIPYPAGAVLFRDYRVRDAISYAAPYLATDETAGFSGFLGQWTLEGSRPGAAAVSCYLSQATLPLSEAGHGLLMKNCVAATQALVDALKERFSGEASWIRLHPFADPDSVGFCFVLIPQNGFTSVASLNEFTERIWRHVTVDGREDINRYDYLLSKTMVDVKAYRHVLAPALDAHLLDEAAAEHEALMLLRVFVLNPFVKEWNEREPSFARLFSDYLYDVAAEVYPECMLRAFKEHYDGRRLQVLVVEEDPHDVRSLARRLQFTPAYAAYLDVHPRSFHQLAQNGDGLPDGIHRVVIDARPEGERQALDVLSTWTGSTSPHVVVVERGTLSDAFYRRLSLLGLSVQRVRSGSRDGEELKELVLHLCR